MISIQIFLYISGANITKEESPAPPIASPITNFLSKEIKQISNNDIERDYVKVITEPPLPPPPSINTKQVELIAMEIEQEKKRKALEEAKKLLGPSNSIEIVPIKRGRKPNEEPMKIPVHEPIVSNLSAFIHNSEDNDELSEPPSVSLPLFEELASKNGTGVRRKIGKGE